MGLTFRSATRRSAYAFILSLIIFFVGGIIEGLLSIAGYPTLTGVWLYLLFIPMFVAIGTVMPFVWFLILVFSKKEELGIED